MLARNVRAVDTGRMTSMGTLQKITMAPARYNDASYFPAAIEAAMPLDWSPFTAFVRRHQRFFLTTHVRPDADGIGKPDILMSKRIQA